MAKVLVSGCYDLLHAGHVRFFQTAAEFGRLYVCLGSDATVEALKGRPNLFNEQERKFIVENLKPVHEARISRGSGLLDFEPEMREIRPDVFVVNEEGASDAKRRLCEELGVRYVVLPRTPAQGLPARSSSAIKRQLEGRA